MLEYLSPFKEATQMTCGEKYPTLSLLVPLYNKLLDHIDYWLRLKTKPGEAFHNAVVATKTKITQYYNTTTDCFTIAIVLRFNLYYYQEDNDTIGNESFLDIKAVVKDHFNRFYKPKNLGSTDASDSLSSTTTLASQIFKKRVYSQDEELDRYVREPVLEVDKFTDVLFWWKYAAKKYPNLSRMARDYLAIPGTSTSSERLFSTATDLLTENRNRLSAPTTQACQCLKSWLKIKK